MSRGWRSEIEQVSQPPFFAVKQLRVTTLDSGRKCVRHVVLHPGGAGVVALVGDEVLCVEQYRPAIGALSLEIPAGRRESGETSEENAARELLEETGYVAGQLTPLGRLHAVPCFSTWEAELYLACDARRSTRVELENDLPLRTVRVPLDDVERLIAEGRLTDGKTIVGLLLARSALR